MKKNQTKKKLNKLLFTCICALSMCLSLTGCSNDTTKEEITVDLDNFLHHCGNADYGLAIEYIADTKDQEGYDKESSKDTTGLIWTRIPELVQEKMPDNTQAQLESRKYVGYGLNLVYDKYEITDIEVDKGKGTATAYVKGNGPAITWESIENIYQNIATATEEEFKDDYSYYKDKIESTSQTEVFNDIRNKVANPVFKKLMKDLDKQEEFNYIQAIKLKKDDKTKKWKITNIVMTREDSKEKDDK